MQREKALQCTTEYGPDALLNTSTDDIIERIIPICRLEVPLGHCTICEERLQQTLRSSRSFRFRFSKNCSASRYQTRPHHCDAANARRRMQALVSVKVTKGGPMDRTSFPEVGRFNKSNKLAHL